MTWTIEYYEQQDGIQPAEAFEDELDRDQPKLAGKLLRATDQLAVRGPQTGAGLVEKCCGYPGLWEVRAIFSQFLAREPFGFDGSRRPAARICQACWRTGVHKRPGSRRDILARLPAFTPYQS
jgi:hypothetical protein